MLLLLPLPKVPFPPAPSPVRAEELCVVVLVGWSGRGLLAYGRRGSASLPKQRRQPGDGQGQQPGRGQAAAVLEVVVVVKVDAAAGGAPPAAAAAGAAREEGQGRRVDSCCCCRGAGGHGLGHLASKAGSPISISIRSRVRPGDLLMDRSIDRSNVCGECVSGLWLHVLVRHVKQRNTCVS